MIKRLFVKRILILLTCIVLFFSGAIIFILQADRTLSLDPQVVKLQKLSMVWGFAKYAHLAFLTGERSWDEELLNLIPIIRAADPEAVNDILYNWFIGLGNDGFDDNESIFLWVPVDYNQPKPGILYYSDFLEMIEGKDWLSQIGRRDEVDYTSIGLRVDKKYLEVLDENDEFFSRLHSLQMIDEEYMRPLIDMDWLKDESFLGRPLAAVLSRFNETPVMNRAKAPVYFDASGKSDFTNEPLYADMDFQDANYRLLGLFRLWNALKYFSPYIDIIDSDWNAILYEHISMTLEATDRLSYELTLMSLASNLHDAHVFFVSPLGSNGMDRFDHIFGEYVAPVKLTEAEGYLVVIEQIHIPISEYKHGIILMPGDVVLKVNGIDINEIVSNMLQYVSYPNEEKALFYLNSYIILRQRSSDELMELDILRDGSPVKVEIQTVSRRRYARHFMLTLPATSYERLENNIGLINPSRINPSGTEDGSIQQIMHYFADTRGLIVDLRQRPSFFPFELTEYLVETTQLYATATAPSQSVPGLFIDRYRGYAGGLSGEYENVFLYENSVVLLMDENTASMPETAVMALCNGANVTVMGSNSLGANGDVRPLPLPGGVTMNFSSIGFFTPEGGQTQRIGLVPDIYIPRTIAGIRDGRDELLEAAIQYLLKGNPPQ